MYVVFNSQDLKVMVTDSEVEAEFFAWLYGGYYL